MATLMPLGYVAKVQGWTLLLHGRDGLETTLYHTLGGAFQGWSRSLANGIWTALGRRLGSRVLLAVMAEMWFLWVTPWGIVLRSLGAGMLWRSWSAAFTSWLALR